MRAGSFVELDVLGAFAQGFGRLGVCQVIILWAKVASTDRKPLKGFYALILLQDAVLCSARDLGSLEYL